MVDDWLARVDTRHLRRGDHQTVALVVWNPSETVVDAVAVLHARFPIRLPLPPVAVFTPEGNVVPWRIVNSSLTPDAALGEKQWWEFDLEFFAAQIPARGWASFAATYENVQVDDTFWQSAAAFPKLRAWEKPCQPGDLPARGALPAIY